ncbi:MAG: hypothetical protein ACM3OO_08325 [Planctomycetaceae bacterium]
MRERAVERLCLRCDWIGPTTAKTCPSCGTPLYRPAPARTRPLPQAPPVRRRVRLRRRRARPPRRRRLVIPERARGAAGMTAVIVVAVLAVGVIGRSPGPRAPATSSPRPPATLAGLGGFLVYTAPATAGDDRLWVWDLAGGRVLEGPRVPKVVALVDPYRQTPDAWLGLTVEHGDGQRALLMRSWGPSAQPDTVLTGDQVGWSPGGLNVTAATIGGDRTCGHLSLRTVLPGYNLTQTSDARDPVCGVVRSVAWGAAAPFVDVVGGGSSTIFQASSGLRQVLADKVLLGVSANSDLLVEPFSCVGPGAGPTTSTCGGMGVVPHADGHATHVFYPPERPFLAESVAAWSTNGRVAYLVGTLHDVHGVYAVRLTEAGAPSAPKLVWQSLASDQRVALTDEGRVILARDGIVSLMRPTGPVVLDRPGGPTPSGPIVWMRSLPYSP